MYYSGQGVARDYAEAADPRNASGSHADARMIAGIASDAGVGERRMNGEELQASGIVGGGEPFQTQPAEQSREDLHRKKEVRAAGDPSAAVEREPAAWHDHMQVRMMAPTPTIP